MGRKALRVLVVSGALVAGVGLAGVSAASAVVPPDSGAPARIVTRSYVPKGVTRTATVNGLRVRTGPGTRFRILGQIYAGDRVRVIASARDGRGQRWDFVKLQRASAGGLPRGYRGWVTEAYLY